MSKLDSIITDYTNHSKSDYVGLWQIAARFRDQYGPSDNGEVRRNSLAVVVGIVKNGLRPGDYLKTGFKFWPETETKAIVARIDREWTQLKNDPTLADPICWFGTPATRN